MSFTNALPRWSPLALSVLLFACDDRTMPTDASDLSPQPAIAARTAERPIAFVSNRDNPNGNFDIYTMNQRGKDVTRLTTYLGSDAEPRWSPDRSRLVFVREGELLVMNADGSEQTNLTNTPLPTIENAPTWAPDGSKIAFASNLSTGFQRNLYVMNVDGSNMVRITTAGPADDMTPDWSPDGSRIVFVRSQAEGSGPPVGDIFVVNPDGSGLTNLTNAPSAYGGPRWSPDGLRIAFGKVSSDPGVQSSEIFVMNADGSGPVNISNDPAFDSGPSWSPDGTQIVFTSGRVQTPTGPNSDIFVMNSDGSQQKNLTRNSLAEDFSPDWAW